MEAEKLSTFKGWLLMIAYPFANLIKKLDKYVKFIIFVSFVKKVSHILLWQSYLR